MNINQNEEFGVQYHFSMIFLNDAQKCYGIANEIIDAWKL